MAPLPAAALLEASERRPDNRRRKQGGTACFTPLTKLGRGRFLSPDPPKQEENSHGKEL